MIFCCYAKITRQWDKTEIADKLRQLPQKLMQDLLRKRKWTDQQLSIAGKLLLIRTLREFGTQGSLNAIQYNSYSRPYIKGGIDFNIAHSGNIVICCGTDAGMIGCDIEQINEISLEDYTDYFTTNEWKLINFPTNRYEGFYEFWTRKEAVLKAIGTGFHTPLSSVDVSDDHIIYDDIDYYISRLNIDENYKCHIAATVSRGNITLVPVELE